MQVEEKKEQQNYDQVCEFSSEGCEKSCFTEEGLKKHNDEYFSKHLVLMHKKIESIENDYLAGLKQENSQILKLLGDLINENKELSSKLNNRIINGVKKLGKKGRPKKSLKLLGNKHKRNEGSSPENVKEDVELSSDEEIEISQNAKKKIKKGSDTSPNKSSNKEDKSDNDKKASSSNKQSKSPSSIKRKDNKNKKNKTKARESVNESEKYMSDSTKMQENNPSSIITSEEKGDVEPEDEKNISSSNDNEKKKQNLNEDKKAGKNKAKGPKETKNISRRGKSKSVKGKENSTLIQADNEIINFNDINEFKYYYDGHVLNSKKISWDVFLKKATGWFGIGLAEKEKLSENMEDIQPEEKILNVDEKNNKTKTDFLLDNEHNINVWKQGNISRTINKSSPSFKEGDILTFIYSPKFNQLKIQKGKTCFTFEDINYNTEQLLVPCIVFSNRENRAIFKNFKVLADYKK